MSLCQVLNTKDRFSDSTATGLGWLRERQLATADIQPARCVDARPTKQVLKEWHGLGWTYELRPLDRLVLARSHVLAFLLILLKLLLRRGWLARRE